MAEQRDLELRLIKAQDTLERAKREAIRFATRVTVPLSPQISGALLRPGSRRFFNLRGSICTLVKKANPDFTFTDIEVQPASRDRRGFQAATITIKRAPNSLHEAISATIRDVSAAIRTAQEDDRILKLAAAARPASTKKRPTRSPEAKQARKRKRKLKRTSQYASGP